MVAQAWTPKRAAAKSRRKLKSIREQLYGIAYLWGDFDNYTVVLVDEILDSVNSLEEAIADHTAGDAS
jgi:hypoxanthine phosphoribosyltransferase